MSRVVLIAVGMICMAQALENRGLRQRIIGVEQEYERFLAVKSGGQALRDKIRPGSFAVFGYKGHRLACGLLNGGDNGKEGEAK